LNLQTHTRRRGSNYDVMSSTGQKNKNKSKEEKKRKWESWRIRSFFWLTRAHQRLKNRFEPRH
jgi:hypothetical protein